MKKKLSILLLSVLVLPLCLLFGCDEKQSFSVNWTSSATMYGDVSGNGAVGSSVYEEGSTVTLTARAKNGSSVVAWVRQNTQLLSNGDVYKIENTTSEDEKVVTSTLTFSMSAATQGKYTAVFDDPQQMYVKLEGVMISHLADVVPVDEITTSMSPAEAIPPFTVSVSQTSEQTQVFQGSDIQFEQASSLNAEQQNINVAKLVHPEQTDAVMSLKEQQIVMAQLTAGGLSKNFAANISFRQQDATWSQQNEQTSSCKINYNAESKQYFVVFPFEFTLESGSIDEGTYSSITYNLFLTLIYKNL